MIGDLVCVSAYFGGNANIRIRRRVKKTSRKPCINFSDAAAIISYLGWIYHSNSYKYMDKYILPYIEIKKLKDVIRDESRKRHNATTALPDRC